MPTERESNEVKKSMAYDLIQILEEKPKKDNYTAEEIKKIIKTTSQPQPQSNRGAGNRPNKKR